MSEAVAAPQGQSSSVVLNDRRACVRYTCHVPIYCHLPSAGLQDSWWRAMVRDISTDGIGLVLDRWVKPGTILEVELHSAAPPFSRTLGVPVIHATLRVDRIWFIGGAFVSKLREEELQAWLSGSKSGRAY